MHNLPDESAQNFKDSTNMHEHREPRGRFVRELRLSKNSCPLCNFVQKEIGKGNPLPVEEWIYLAHLRNTHGIEP
jgi:hypothetical protein